MADPMKDETTESLLDRYRQGNKSESVELVTDPSEMIPQEDLDTSSSLLEKYSTDPSQAAALQMAKMVQGSGVDSSRLRRAAEIANRLDYSTQLVYLNLEEFEKLSAQEEADLPRKLSRSATMRRYLQDPSKVGYIVDDLAALEGIEWWMEGIPYAWGRGKAMLEYGMAGYDQLTEAGDQDEVRDRIASLREQLNPEIPRYVGAEKTWLRRVTSELVQSMGPQMIGAGAEGVKTGLALGGAAGIAGQLGPQALIPEEFATVTGGFGLGFRAGVLNYNRKVMSGHTYLALEEMRDDYGNPLTIDDGMKAFLSHLGGSVAAISESVGMGSASKMIPGFKQLSQKVAGRSLAKALKRKTFYDIVKGVGKDYAVGVASETATEVIQDAIQIAMEEMAKSIDDGAWTHRSPEEVLTQLWDTTLQVAEMMALGGIYASPGNIYVNSRVMTKSKADYARIDRLDRAAKESKLRKETPQEFNQFIMTGKEAPGAPQEIYIKVSFFERIAEKLSPGDTAEDVAAAIMGDGGEAYRKALEMGAETDLVIPIEKYLANVAGTDLSAELKAYTRLDQSAISLSETAEIEADIPKWADEGAKRAVADFNEEEFSVFQRLYNMHMSAGMNHQLSDTSAKQMVGVLSNLAKRGGVSLTQLASQVRSIEGEVSLITDSGQAVHAYVSKRSGRVLTKEENDVRSVTLGIEKGNKASIKKAASEMAEKVAPGTVLVPAPGKGNLELAQAIAELVEGVTVVDALETDGDGRTQRQRRRRGEFGLRADEIQVSLKEGVDAPENAVVVAASRATGALLEAATGPLKGSTYLAYSQGGAEVGGQRAMFQEAPPVDSPEFKEFFGNSVVVDSQGNPLVLYRGTLRILKDGKLTSSGTSESFLGDAIYATDNPDDASENYARGGVNETGFSPDIDVRIEQRAEQIFQELEEDEAWADKDGDEIQKEARRRAENEFVDHGGAVVPMYVRIENPADLRVNGTTLSLEVEYETEPFEDEVKEQYKEDHWDGEQDLNEFYEENDSEIQDLLIEAAQENGYEEETGTLHTFLETLDRVANRYHDINESPSIAVRERFYPEGGEDIRLADLVNFLTNAFDVSRNPNLHKAESPIMYASGEEGEMVAAQIVQETLRDMGFDGIIHHAEIFNRMEHVQGTNHYIFFDSKQAKSPFNSGTWSREDGRILRQAVEVAESVETEEGGRENEISVAYDTGVAAEQRRESGEHHFDRQIGRAHFKESNPEAYTKQILAMAQSYLNIPKNVAKWKDPDKVADYMIRQFADTLKFLHDKMPEEWRERTKLWYDGANKVAREMAEANGLDVRQASGVLARLSPKNHWFDNVENAADMVDMFSNKRDEPMTRSQARYAKKISKKVFPKLKDKIVEGMTIDSIEASSEAEEVKSALIAIWMRSHGEHTIGARKRRIFTPEGGVDGVDVKDWAWTSFDNLWRSVSILRDGSVENVSEMLGKGHKIRSFYNNIVSPNSRAGHVTVDTHAVGAMMLRAMTLKSREVLHNFGSTLPGEPARGRWFKGWRRKSFTEPSMTSSATVGVNGTYWMGAEAYRLAAEELGILPRELQSITWEAIRGLVPDEGAKIKGILQEAIDRVWYEFKQGRMSLDAVREKVWEISGSHILEPSWIRGREGQVRPDASVDGRDAGGVDASQLPPGERGGQSSRPRSPLGVTATVRRYFESLVRSGYSAREAATQAKYLFSMQALRDHMLETGVPIPEGGRIGNAITRAVALMGSRTLEQSEEMVPVDTESPEFKSWFGNSAVRQSTGEPLVVYHGTDAVFSEFVEDGDLQPGAGGFFFARDPETAGDYGSAVMPVYLSISNPYVVSYSDLQRGKASNVDALRDEGYDGILVEGYGVDDGEFYDSQEDVWIAFDPEQIKSSISNTGKFDPRSPRILEQSAYHGGPNEIDGPLSTDYIGTGENTLGQGWGVYLSSKESVARWYRESLTDSSLAVSFDGSPPASQYLKSNSPQDYALYILSRSTGAFNGATIEDGIDTVVEQMKRFGGRRDGKDSDPLLLRVSTPGKGSIMVRASHVNAATDWLEANRENITVSRSSGSLVEVTIPDDEEMLDWRKKLKDQSPEVLRKAKEAWKEIGRSDLSYEQFQNLNGEFFYHLLQTHFENEVDKEDRFDTMSGLETEAKKQASLLLKEYGIPGHVYQSASGNKNFVIYDDNAMDINRQLEQAQEREKKKVTRGTIQIGGKDFGTRTFDIRLLKDKNSSTIFHESAHMYMEMLFDLAEVDGADPELAKDRDAIMKWLRGKVYITDPETGKRRRPRKDELSTRSQLIAMQTEFAREGNQNGGPMEKFARAYETYLREGHVPTDEMRFVMAKIKAMMTAVYQSVKGMVTIDEEIVDIFDRMAASDEAIAQAKTSTAYEPIPEIRDGMSDEEYLRYLDDIAAANQEGEDETRAIVAGEHAQTLSSEYQSRKDEVRAEVMKRIENFPLMKLLRFMQHGEMPSTEKEVPESLKDSKGRPLRLSAKSVRKAWGKDALRSMRGLTDRSGGVTVEEAALLFGFESVDEMKKAVLKEDRLTWMEAVNAEVDKRMEGEFGSIVDDAAKMAEEASGALNNWRRVSVAMRELMSLRRRLSPDKLKKSPMFSLKQLKKQAKEQIAKMGAAKLSPHQFLQKVQSANAAAFEAAKRGDLAEAYDEKRMAVWFMTLYRTARDAQRDVEKRQRLMRRIQGKRAMERFSKAGYWEVIQSLLSDYSFTSTPPTVEVDGQKVTLRGQVRAQLQKFVDTQAENGNDIALPASVLERVERIHWSELTYEEYVDLTDTIDSLDHNAKLKTTLKQNNQRRAFDAARGDLISALRSSFKGGKYEDSKAKQRKGKGWRKNAKNFTYAWMVKLESLINMIDGGDYNGVWSQLIMQPLNEAQENYDVKRRETLAPLQKLIDSFTSKQRKVLNSEVYIESLGESLPFEDLLIVALNTGSESNYQRLIDGGIAGVDPAKWGDDAINEILAALDQHDWAWGYVQEIWDTVNSLWPEIVALETRLVGRPPNKVEALPSSRTLANGETIRVEGGYFPLVYDPKSNVGMKQVEESRNTGTLFTLGLNRAATNTGHTKERVSNFDGALSRDFDTVFRHIDTVIRDLTHREALIQIHKIITDDEIKAEMYDRLGEHVWKEVFYDLLMDLSKPGAKNKDGLMDKVSGFLRRNAQTAIMGLRVGPVIQNIANISNVHELIKGKYLRAAYAGVFTEKGREKYALVAEKSMMMRDRILNLDRDIRDVMTESLQREGLVEAQVNKVRRASMKPIALTDMLISFPAWIAAYEQSLVEQEATRQKIEAAIVRRKIEAGQFANSASESEIDAEIERRAVAEADSKIRLMLTGGGAKDLSRIQRTGEGYKMITMLYGWFSGVFQRADTLRHDMGVAKDEGELIARSPEFMARVLSAFVIPAIASAYLVGNGPKGSDDEEERQNWIAWALLETGYYVGSSVPIMRDGVGTLYRMINGEFSQARPTITGEMAADVASLASEIIEIATQEEELDKQTAEKTAKTAADIIGALTGLPTSQAKTTVGYITDLATGEQEAEGPTDVLSGLAYYRPEEEKNKP